MKFNAALALFAFPLLTMAAPAADPQPVSLPAPNPLEKRDVWCVVNTSDGRVNCREKATSKSKQITQIGPNDKFGVQCKKKGQSVNGVEWWDYIPGWGCYVSAYYTRPYGSRAQCETGVSVCPS